MNQNIYFHIIRDILILIFELGIPIAYPRMVFLESALESKFNPLVALGRNGSLGLSGFVNKFNAQAELLDDLVRFIFLLYFILLTHTRRTITGLLDLIRFVSIHSSFTLLTIVHYDTERTQLVHSAITKTGVRKAHADNVFIGGRALCGCRGSENPQTEER